MSPSPTAAREVDWPARWQPEAIEALTPHLGSDERFRIVVDDPKTAIHGTVLEGHVYVENGIPMFTTTEAVGRTSSRGVFSAARCITAPVVHVPTALLVLPNNSIRD